MYLGSLFLNEWIFFFHPLPFGFPEATERAIYTPGRRRALAIVAWVRRGLNITSVVLFAIGEYAVAAWLLGASALIWAVLYGFIERLGLEVKDTDSSQVYNAWGLAHIGAINWFFDVPGHGCPTTRASHVIIILLNVAG